MISGAVSGRPSLWPSQLGRLARSGPSGKMREIYRPGESHGAALSVHLRAPGAADFAVESDGAAGHGTERSRTTASMALRDRATSSRGTRSAEVLGAARRRRIVIRGCAVDGAPAGPRNATKRAPGRRPLRVPVGKSTRGGAAPPWRIRGRAFDGLAAYPTWSRSQPIWDPRLRSLAMT